MTQQNHRKIGISCSDAIFNLKNIFHKWKPQTYSSYDQRKTLMVTKGPRFVQTSANADIAQVKV
ncbi:hypothetical protein Ciccas_004767 [Cichlidogyrus casuarinus]|uniref:Uncharacterized protein n=1 Tax=Cichlidogyrus casuarinus TaxID=1844966 RepID=A0ABD2QAR5_9PLAT